MKRQLPQKHSPDEIRKALALLQSGKSLTDVAKEFEISKGLLSYWRDHAAQMLPSEGVAVAPTKADGKSLKFIESCWKSIALAFKKLDTELKQEKPHGVRDLALAIAVLADKMSQARQSLQAQAAPATAQWSVSEDTLVLLRRHREAKVEQAPLSKEAEAGLEVADVKPEKKTAVGGPSEAGHVGDKSPTSQPGRAGGN